MLFISYFLKNVTASIGCYIHTSSRLLKLGSNFREICLARRVPTARSHPYCIVIQKFLNLLIVITLYTLSPLCWYRIVICMENVILVKHFLLCTFVCQEKKKKKKKKKTLLCSILKKIFLFPKMAAILNF